MGEVRQDYRQLRDEVRQESQPAQQQAAAQSARMDALTAQITKLTASLETLAGGAPAARACERPSSSATSGSSCDAPSSDGDTATLVLFREALTSEAMLVRVRRLLDPAIAEVRDDAVSRPPRVGTTCGLQSAHPLLAVAFMCHIASSS